MGEVYLAMSGHRDLETLCVIKRLLPALLSQPSHVRQFRHEADLARRLVHSNLVHTHAIGEVDDAVFLAQEFIEGHDASALIDEMAAQRRTLPVAVAAYIVGEIARGLAYAHAFEALDLVHRDINLPNVRLSYAGEVKLLDFGIASSNLHEGDARAHGGAGKLWSLAPEQIQPGRMVDRRTDIYALGVLLWELLTQRPIGTVRHEGREVRLAETEGEVMAWVVRGEHAPPSLFNPEVPPAMDRLVGRAMRIRPEERFATAEEMRAALTCFVPAGFDAEEYLATLMKSLFCQEREKADRAQSIEAGRHLLEEKSWSQNELPRIRNATHVRSASRAWLRTFRVHWLGPILLGGAAGLTALFWLQRHANNTVPSASTESARVPGVSSPPVEKPSGVGAEPLAGFVPAPVAPPAVLDGRLAAVATKAPRVPAPVVRRAEIPNETSSATNTSGSVSHLAIARQAFNERDWLRALAEGEKAVSTGGGADAHSIVGNTFFKMGRFTEAAEEFAKAAKLNPGNRLLEERLRLAQTRAQEKITGEAP